MGYIMDLRKVIGHRPIIMTSACCIILNEKNEVLLQLRKDNNLYSYPGGSLELHETFEEACIREVKEETGLTISSLHLFSLNSGENMHYIYPNNDEVYIAEACFITNDYCGEEKIQEDEVISQNWFSLDSLPDNIFKVNKNTLTKLKLLIENNQLDTLIGGKK